MRGTGIKLFVIFCIFGVLAYLTGGVTFYALQGGVPAQNTDAARVYFWLPKLSLAELLRSQHSRTITWSLDDRSVTAFLTRAEIFNAVKQTISNPRGWRRAGLHFTYVRSLKLADLRIRIVTEKISCGSNGGKSIVGCAISKKTYCEVTLSDEFLSRRWRTSRDWPHLVNHELGHCLGFPHSRNPNDVMRPRDAYIPFPSNREIAKVKKSIGNGS